MPTEVDDVYTEKKIDTQKVYLISSHTVRLVKNDVQNVAVRGQRQNNQHKNHTLQNRNQSESECAAVKSVGLNRCTTEYVQHSDANVQKPKLMYGNQG
jgi:hypothetical protein